MNRKPGEPSIQENYIPHYFFRFTYLLMRGFSHYVADELKLNKTQARTVMVLTRKGSRTMTELVQDLNIEKGSMTSVVDCIIDKGLALRERDRNDRQRVIISLTASGKELAADLAAELDTHIREKLDQLGPGNAAAVKEFVNILKESIDIWENQSET